MAPAAVLALLALLHQQTAPYQNNRYLKLTCMESQLRIAYTILYGDLPAEAERRAMDRDGNGTISEDEAHAWGAELARRIEPRLSIELDGHPLPLRFDTIDVGLGTDRGVHPVPFSIDLIVLVPTGGGDHTVVLDDRFPLARPGEMEVVLEEAPGTRVRESWRGRAGQGLAGLKWVWPVPRASDQEDRSVGFRYGREGGPDRASTAGPRAGALVAACGLALLASLVAAALGVAIAEGAGGERETRRQAMRTGLSSAVLSVAAVLGVGGLTLASGVAAQRWLGTLAGGAGILFGLAWAVRGAPFPRSGQRADRRAPTPVDQAVHLLPVHAALAVLLAVLVRVEPLAGFLGFGLFAVGLPAITIGVDAARVRGRPPLAACWLLRLGGGLTALVGGLALLVALTR
jgi:hypothetical protein